MTTVVKKGALHLVDWGPLRYKAFHLPMSMHTTHKYHAHDTQIPCTRIVGDGPHALGVFGAGPASLLLCHTSTVERLDLRG